MWLTQGDEDYNFPIFKNSPEKLRKMHISLISIVTSIRMFP